MWPTGHHLGHNSNIGQTANIGQAVGLAIYSNIGQRVVDWHHRAHWPSGSSRQNIASWPTGGHWHNLAVWPTGRKLSLATPCLV